MTKKGTINKKHPAGDILLEIQDQDLTAPVGGSTDGVGEEMNTAITVVSPITIVTISPIVTKGAVCQVPLTTKNNCM